MRLALLTTAALLLATCAHAGNLYPDVVPTTITVSPEISVHPDVNVSVHPDINVNVRPEIEVRPEQHQGQQQGQVAVGQGGAGGQGGAADARAVSQASTSSTSSSVSGPSTATASGNGAGQSTTVNQNNRYRRNAVATAIGAGAQTWSCGKTIGLGGQVLAAGGSFSVPIGTSSYCAILSALAYTDNPGCFARVLVVAKMTGQKRKDVLAQNNGCPALEPLVAAPSPAPQPSTVILRIETPAAQPVVGERG